MAAKSNFTAAELIERLSHGTLFVVAENLRRNLSPSDTGGHDLLGEVMHELWLADSCRRDEEGDDPMPSAPAKYAVQS